MSAPRPDLSNGTSDHERLSADGRRKALDQMLAPGHRARRIHRVTPLESLPSEDAARAQIDGLFARFPDRLFALGEAAKKTTETTEHPRIIYTEEMTADLFVASIEEISLDEHAFIFTDVVGVGPIFACLIPVWSLDRVGVDAICDHVTATNTPLSKDQESKRDVTAPASSGTSTALEAIESNPPLEGAIDLPRRASIDGKAYVQHLDLTPRGTAADMREDVATAFATLLARYSGQDAFNIGIQQHQRAGDGVGHHADWWVAPLSPAMDTTFSDLRGQLKGALARRTLPFSAMAPRVDDEIFTLHPVFQAGVVFVPPSRSSHVWNLEERLDAHSMLDIELRVYEAAEGSWTAQMLVAKHLYHEQSARQIASHFERFLGMTQTALHATTLTDTLLWGRPAIDDAELSYWRDTFNASDAHVNRDLLVHEMIEENVERYPERIAIKDMEREWTYASLNVYANRVAHRLVEAGIAEDVRVGVFSERHAYFLSSILGVFKAGGAFIPIDPNYPADRIQHILRIGECDTILYDEASKASLLRVLGESHGKTLISMETAAEEERGDNANLPRRQTEDGLAYVIFTSGSTGLPKGAMVEQKGMRNHLFAKAFDLDFGDADRILQNSSQCFDISVFQYLIGGLFGGMVRVVDNDTALDPRKFMDVVHDDDISIVELVPSAGRALLTYQSCAQKVRESKALRWMIFTGEALPPALANDWLALAPHVPIMNAYGPTECSDDVAHETIAEPLPAHVVNTPVGKPIANMRLYVLDKGGHIAPVGVHGELVITGVGVGRGYLNDPERTAKAFIPNQLDDTSAMAYRTGDRIRLLHSGTLEFLGRIDHQVKIRGFRIELGEIETALQRHPGISESIVVGIDGANGDKALAGYYVAPADVTVAVAREFLKTVLPGYMVPQFLIRLDAMPLSPNGKIQRSALPSPNAAVPEIEFVAAETPIERRLVQMWRDLLGETKISTTANFFDLGGDSLKALELFAHIQEEYGLDLQIARIFEAPTVRELARLLDRRVSLAERAESQFAEGRFVVPIRARGAKHRLFCVHGAGGNVVNLYHLAKLLPEDIDFFGLQAQGVDGRHPPHTSIAAMRDAYLAEMIAQGPVDDLILAGFSGGGLVALEMARELRKRGHRVKGVVLLDTYSPLVERVTTTVHQKLSKFRRRGFDYVRERASEILHQKRTGWELRGYELLGRPLPHKLRERKLWDAFSQNESDYRCQPYDGCVILARAEVVDDLYRHAGADCGWSALLSDLHIVTSPGDHESMVQAPHVKTLATVLASALTPVLEGSS